MAGDADKLSNLALLSILLTLFTVLYTRPMAYEGTELFRHDQDYTQLTNPKDLTKVLQQMKNDRGEADALPLTNWTKINAFKTRAYHKEIEYDLDSKDDRKFPPITLEVTAGESQYKQMVAVFRDVAQALDEQCKHRISLKWSPSQLPFLNETLVNTMLTSTAISLFIQIFTRFFLNYTLGIGKPFTSNQKSAQKLWLILFSAGYFSIA